MRRAEREGAATFGAVHLLPELLEGAPAPDTRYAGSERLARMGLDHATVHSALTGDRVPLTPDPRPVEQYLDEAASPNASRRAGTSPTDPGTGPLVELLLTERTRARQLVEALTATPGH